MSRNLALVAERVRTLREMLGLTQAELSASAGISQAMLSSVEQLRRDATPELLSAIAAATDTPETFFDVETLSIPPESLHFRKNKTASVRLTRQAARYYSESHRVAAQLLDRVNYPVSDFPVADSRTTTVSGDDIEQFASQARAFLRVDQDDPIPHLTRALERAGTAVFRMSLPGAEAGKVVGAGHYGLSYWPGIGERPAIAFFSGSGDRDRFTIAHELGHLILHSFRKSSEQELEANRFAGALLFPRERAEDLVSEHTTLSQMQRIKAVFGISIQAIIMRASDLGLISDTRKKVLQIQVSQRGWRKAEPVEVRNEHPSLLGKALLRLWPRRTYIQGSHELAIQPMVLSSLAPAPNGTRPAGQGVDGSIVRLLK